MSISLTSDNGGTTSWSNTIASGDNLLVVFCWYEDGAYISSPLPLTSVTYGGVAMSIRFNGWAWNVAGTKRMGYAVATLANPAVGTDTVVLTPRDGRTLSGWGYVLNGADYHGGFSNGVLGVGLDQHTLYGLTGGYGQVPAPCAGLAGPVSDWASIYLFAATGGISGGFTEGTTLQTITGPHGAIGFKDPLVPANNGLGFYSDIIPIPIPDATANAHVYGYCYVLLTETAPPPTDIEVDPDPFALVLTFPTPTLTIGGNLYVSPDPLVLHLSFPVPSLGEITNANRHGGYVQLLGLGV